MKTKQFQPESLILTKQNRFAQRAGRALPQPNVTANGIMPMLLTVCLSGRLTDDDCLFLDDLAPLNSIAFLIKEGRFIHPAEVALFPMAIIETNLAEGGEAIYSHRYKNPDRSAVEYQIHSTLVNPHQSGPVILGFFGPVQEMNLPQTASQFCELAARCQKAYKTITPIVRELNEQLEKLDPVIIVNRSSGRIISTNPAARKLLQMDPDQLTGHEFGEIKSKLSPLLSSLKLTFDNKSFDELHISIITLIATGAGQPMPTSVQFLIDRVRSKLAAIDTAISMIEPENGSDKVTGQTSNINELSTGTTQAGQALAQLDLILNKNSWASSECNIATEIRRLVDELGHENNSPDSITATDLISNFIMTLPDKAFYLFMEAVLYQHLINSVSTTISMQPQMKPDTVLITVKTELKSPADMSGRSDSQRQLAIDLGLHTKATLPQAFTVSQNQMTTMILLEA